jgi:hypothetical protein
VLVAFAPLTTLAAEAELSAKAQAALDKQKKIVAGWAMAPEILAATRTQNAQGPIADLDNARWRSLRTSDPVVKGFQESAAGKALKARIDASPEVYCEAFLSAAKGEKVAFAAKTTYYLHRGKPKFDVPFDTGKPWQGKPEFDESSQNYSVQLSVPVLDGGKPIGVLVVGLKLASLERAAK